MNLNRSLFGRFVASLLSFILIQTAPGLGVYEVLAQVRANAGAATGANPVITPLSLRIDLPAPAGAVNPLNAPGLAPSLSAPGLAPVPVVPVAAPKHGAVVTIPVSAVPLSFRSPLLPAAAKAVSQDAPAARGSAASALTRDVQAVVDAPAAKTPSSAPAALLGALGRVFDGSSIKGNLDVVLPAASAGDASRPSALEPARAPAASASDEVPTPPSAPGAPQAPKKSKVSVGLALAALGGAAAWYTTAWAAATIGGLLAPWVAIPALAFTFGWPALGVLAGFAAFSVETWTGFPAALKDSAVSAGRMTFRFWGRFGLIFDSVIRGKSADEAMKTELSANILTYPVIAWLFVLAGYVMAPVAFVLGAGYRLVGTPFLAAFRGAREVIVGFLPWMGRVFRFLGKLVVRIFPFMGGLIWGALKGVFVSAAAGAVILAGPIARDAFEHSSYKPATVPGWLGYRLTQLAAFAATLVTGAAGAAIGLASGLLHAVMYAFHMAFQWARFSEGAETFFKRWVRSIEKDGAFEALTERRFPAAPAGLTLAGRVARVLNGTLIAAYTAFFIPFVSLAAFVRASYAAYKGIEAENADTNPNRKEDEGAETKVEPRAGAVLPAALALLGAAALAGAAGYLLILPLTLANIGLLAAAAAVGATAGLALSQPQAWSGFFGAIASDARLTGAQSFGGWLDAGARTGAALSGDAVPAAGASKLWLALPALFGGIAAAVSAVLGGLQGAAGKYVAASWAGFMAVITQFLPALKRFFERALEILKNVVPWSAGFVIGFIGGVLRSGWWFAPNLFLPLASALEREDGRRRDPRERRVEIALAMTVIAPLAIFAVGVGVAAAVFAGGFVFGAIVGLPVAVTRGLAKGSRWAGTSREDYYRTWESRSLPRALKEALAVAKPALSGEGRESAGWRVIVRTFNWAFAVVPTALALAIAGGKAYRASLEDAKLESSAKPAGTPSEAAAQAPAEAADEAPIPDGNAALAAALGAIGLGAGVTAAIFLAPGWLAGLAGWKLWALGAAAYAGVPAAATGLGLAASQPALWKRLIPGVVSSVRSGWTLSYDYWLASGEAAGARPLYALPGVLFGLVFGAAGAAYGALESILDAAYRGAGQVVREILPFLRWVWETAERIARRIFPFLFGLAAGLVSGVVGAAAFGALLLGRPYFKHVVADDFKHEGALGFLGNVFLKFVALVLGVVFGLVGVLAGVIAAAPYALTAMVSFAFRFAEIGGPAGKFFDHWTYGSLRAELQRLNQLTDKLEIPEGTPAIADGWIRIANILPLTLAATIAGTFAGWIGYFRSVGVAYKTAKSGAPIPEPVVDREAGRRWDSTWRAAKSAAGSFLVWGLLGGAVGLGLWALTSWTPLGLAGWLLVGAAAGAGAVLALGVGAVIAAIALVLWLDAQLR